MLMFVIKPESDGTMKTRSGKRRMKLRIFDTETNKTYARRSVVALTWDIIKDAINKSQELKQEIEVVQTHLNTLLNKRV